MPRPSTRSASHPPAAAPRGVSTWRRVRHVVPRAFADYRADGCQQLAASISYHALFSLFPLAILLAAAASLVVRANDARDRLADTLVRHLPLSPDGEESLRELLIDATGSTSTLGLLSLVGVVWAASGAMGAIRVALNRAWDAEQTRPYLRAKALDVALLGLVGLLALLSLASTVAVRLVLDQLPDVVGDVGVLRWGAGLAVPLALLFVGAAALYRIVPAVPTRLADVWPGALAAAAGVVVLQNLFALYLRWFADYSVVYGSLSAIVAFLLFVYLSASIFLLGAEIAAEWPRPVPEDEAAARRRPLGQRLRALARGLVVRE